MTRKTLNVKDFRSNSTNVQQMCPVCVSVAGVIFCSMARDILFGVHAKKVESVCLLTLFQLHGSFFEERFCLSTGNAQQG